MLAYKTIDGEGKRPMPQPGGEDRPRPAAPNEGGAARSHEPSHAMDFFHCPTLMEYVEDFLDRYKQAPYGQC
jgi:hypothetical protein